MVITLEGAVWEADDSCAGPSTDEDSRRKWDEQKVIEQIREWADSGIGISEMASKLNERGCSAAKGEGVEQESDLQPAPADGTISPRPITAAVGLGSLEVQARFWAACARPYRATDCVDSE